MSPGNGNQRSNFWALLVGIDDYKAVTSLRGCVSDVVAMREFLIRNMNVPEDHIRALTTDNPDDLPTRAGIISAFQDFLINNDAIQLGDQILFHFSGHGSQIRDTTGVEPDGLNETLVAMDSRDGDVWDIPDKTIAALLDQLVSQKGENITVILDCCHSGSGTRKVATEGTALTRQIPLYDRIPPADLDADIIASPSRRNAGPSGWSSADIPYTLLAACLDREEASEHLAIAPESQTSVWHGALTYFTLDIMRQMAPGMSYAQLHEQAAVKINTLYRQMPQCEGRRDREVFGDSRVERDPFILVKHTKGQITVEAGLIHQLHVGDKLALYAPDVTTQANLPSEPLATIQIVKVMPTTATASNLTPAHDIPELTRALVTEVVYSGQAQTVRLHAATVDNQNNPLRPDQIEANKKAIEELQNHLTNYPSPYLQVLDEATESAHLQVEATQGQYHILNAKGELLVLPEDVHTGLSALASSLESIARFRAIMALENQETSRLTGNIKVAFRHWVEGTAKELSANTLSTGNELTLPFYPNNEENNLYVIEIQNNTAQPVYPQILLLNEDYSIYLLYPEQGEQEAIGPGGKLTTGLNRTGILEVYLPSKEDGPIELDSSRNYLKVVTTTDPADFAILEQKGLNVQPTRSISTRSIKSPLDALLDATTLMGTRCARLRKAPIGNDWAVTTVPYTVVRQYQTTDLNSGSRVVPLNDGLTLEKPENFMGKITVATYEQATRSVDGDAALMPPPALMRRADYQLLSRTGTRSVGDNGLVIALDIDEQSRQSITATNPLRIKLPDAADDNVIDWLPVTFDGEDYLPVGYGVEQDRAIEIISLPPSKPSTKRGIARTTRLFVFKRMGRHTKDIGLRYARRVNGRYDYEPVQREAFKAGDTVAVMVHGFNSETRWMLDDIAVFLHDDVLPYNHVLTWDYESFGTPAEKSGEDLAVALRQQCGFGPDDDITVHVYSHSLGGVVSRCMLELSGGHMFIDGLVEAGPPNAGTPLANTARGSVYLLSTLINEFSVIPPVGVVNWGLKLLYENALTVTDLSVDSNLLRQLNNNSGADNVPYLVLAGSNAGDAKIEERFKRLFHKIFDGSLDAFFGEDNDAVVGLSSQKGVRNGTYPKLTIIDLPCHHFNYYVFPQAREAIKTWIQQIS